MSSQNSFLLDGCRDTREYYKQLSKYGVTKLPPLIITCAITGNSGSKKNNPNFPISFDEILQQACEAYKKGASIISLYCRDAGNPPLPSQSASDYLKINQAIRDMCPDVIINNYCGGNRYCKRDDNGVYTVGDQQVYAIEAGPDMANVDIACHTPDLTKPVAAVMPFDELEKLVLYMGEHGVKPEYTCYALADLKCLELLEGKELLENPTWVQMFFGGNGAAPAAEEMILATKMLPRNSIFSIAGIGAAQTAVAAQAIVLGHHVRVGMADNLNYRYNEPAVSNAQQVERIVAISSELGRPVATPVQARELLGLCNTHRQINI